ncbi:PepSY domain-containing protein [Flavobacterium sp. CGRL2]
MNYGIHTGQILDLPGKIIAFIASLFAAALPVTGFIIWYGRKYKRKRSKA